jgi:ABC-2 type transport system ATP-binding protein
MSNVVLETLELTRHFGATVAVDQLTLTIRQGEIFGFLGHNGAGKTTTVRLVNGVLAPTSGSATVLGLDPWRNGATLRQRTGVLTETPALDDRLTVAETLRFGADLYSLPRPQIDTRIHRLLATFELAPYAQTTTGKLSKGLRQRLALARTLIHDPELIFLDEPTSALDPVATREVHGLITRLSREEGRTIFLCTHNLVEAQRLCHRVAVMARGRLLAQGTPAELAHQYGQRGRVHLTVEAAQEHQVAPAVATRWPHASVQAESGEPGALTIQGIPPDEVPALIQLLVAVRISLYRVTPEQPTLEEVYLALQAGVSTPIGERP